MKFSENWLRELVTPELDTGELAQVLTMAGLEVEAVEPVAPPFDGVVVAQVLAVEPHPDADRLRLCRVDAGGGEPLAIVCGAPNVTPGMKAPLARVGAQLPGGLAIGLAKVRGIASHGMLCSARELGLAQDAGGLLVLPDDAPPGMDLREYLALDDSCLTLKLTPNRSDCLGMVGIAREVAAITAAPLAWTPPAEVSAAISDRIAVTVQAPDACPLYCARVLRGVRADAPTPAWMVRRLERSGLRSISAVVDVTNYVLLEMGQPLHAFDAARLDGGIVVRFATAGEALALLNGQQVRLDADMLVIADACRPHALAGIMGGEDSAVRPGVTTDLVLEAAFFAPQVIAGKSWRLGFGSDSSHRFERGVDFGATRAAMERATALLLEICGGATGPVTEACGELPARVPIRLRPERARRILGIDLDAESMARLLKRLHLGLRADGEALVVTPPSWRFDLAIEEDLIEELARLHGYDRIPAALPPAPLAMLPVPEAAASVATLSRELAARGYQEVITYSFVDPAWEADLAPDSGAIPLRNPLASQLSVMRTTLMGGLLACLRENLRRQHDRVRIFESGRCFVRHEGRLQQPERLGGLAYGAAMPEQWASDARAVDYFDVKGDLEALLHPREAAFVPAQHPALHPGRSARVEIGGQAIGWLGELHPRLRQRWELAAAPVLFELELGALLARPLPRYAEISRFPLVRRDIAVVVDEQVQAQAVLDAMRAAAPAFLTAVRLFDVYRGHGVETGKKSLAFRVLLQDTHRTLTDADADSAVSSLVEVLQKQFHARLRV